MSKPAKNRMSLATKVLIGFVVGVVAGVFFGELISPVGIVGDLVRDAFNHHLRKSRIKSAPTSIETPPQTPAL